MRKGAKELSPFSRAIEKACKNHEMCFQDLVLVWIDYVAMHLSKKTDKNQLKRLRAVVQRTARVELSVKAVRTINLIIDAYDTTACYIEQEDVNSRAYRCKQPAKENYWKHCLRKSNMTSTCWPHGKWSEDFVV